MSPHFVLRHFCAVLLLGCAVSAHAQGEPSTIQGYPMGWGLNGDAQASPIPTNTMRDATAIAGGYEHSLAVHNGRVWTWGSTDFGLTNIPLAALSGVEAVAAGEKYSLALRTNGAVIAWGTGSAATVPGTLDRVAKVVAGKAHALALTQNGHVIAWGNNDVGQCTVPSQFQSDAPVSDIAAGGLFSVALQYGAVTVFGVEATHTNANNIRSIPPAAQSGVSAIAAGEWHALALKNGGVIAWGAVQYDATIVPPAAQSDVVAIAAGDCTSIAIKSDGSVVVWGDGTSNQKEIPLAASIGVKAIAAGKSHILALCSALPPRYIVSTIPNATVSNEYTTGSVTWAGDPAVKYSKTTGPAWLTVNENTGRLGGTPTGFMSLPSTLSFSILASNAVGTSTETFSLTVIAKPALPPVFITTNLPAGIVGAPYLQTIAISNGGTMSVTLGSLPAGLDLDPDGVVFGTPTAVANQQMDICASNAIGSATQRFTMVVTAPAAPVFLTSELSSGVLNQPYSFQVFVTNYPTSIGISAGALPAGLTISETGLISGTPTSVGSASVTFFASNMTSVATRAYTLLINGPPVFITTSLPDGALNAAYSAQLVATDATAFSLFSGTLPSGLTLQANGAISGTPTTAAMSSFTIRATNAYGWVNSPFTITIHAEAPSEPPRFTTAPRITNGWLILNWTNPNASGAISVWRSTNITAANPVWTNLGTGTSPWSNNATVPTPSYYRLILQ